MAKFEPISAMKHSMEYKGIKCYAALYQSKNPVGFGVKVQIGQDALPYTLMDDSNQPLIVDSKEEAILLAQDHSYEAVAEATA
ncbi:hypothetical protein [Vibrio marisflavi]|uniref:Uncharacterized protein n=1 Tax=Vibrio marisflavi CECT 7928 TaxID=634439 RepID=A0ABM9A076_9VIBR|nr:hypothetical protein [Vibrio marisflavi]CAH0536814.1 hypothetical protein VMF7928_00704 [Vibrio marisflavi CECT 7928]